MYRNSDFVEKMKTGKEHPGKYGNLANLQTFSVLPTSPKQLKPSQNKKDRKKILAAPKMM